MYTLYTEYQSKTDIINGTHNIYRRTKMITDSFKKRNGKKVEGIDRPIS